MKVSEFKQTSQYLPSEQLDGWIEEYDEENLLVSPSVLDPATNQWYVAVNLIGDKQAFEHLKKNGIEESIRPESIFRQLGSIQIKK